MRGLFVICVCVCHLALTAQKRLKSDVKLGIKTGPVLTTVTGTGYGGRLNAGFAGGMWLRLKVHKRWKAQVEVFFIEKGTSNKRLLSRFSSYGLRFYYFEVPVLIQYHKNNFAFEFGPGCGYLAAAAEFLQGSPISGNLADASPFRETEISFNTGVVYTFSESWHFNLRYTNSVVPIRNYALGQKQFEKSKLFNCVLALSFAHRLKNKGPRKIEEQQE